MNCDQSIRHVFDVRPACTRRRRARLGMQWWLRPCPTRYRLSRSRRKWSVEPALEVVVSREVTRRTANRTTARARLHRGPIQTLGSHRQLARSSASRRFRPPPQRLVAHRRGRFPELEGVLVALMTREFGRSSSATTAHRRCDRASRTEAPGLAQSHRRRA